MRVSASVAIMRHLRVALLYYGVTEIFSASDGDFIVARWRNSGGAPESDVSHARGRNPLLRQYHQTLVFSRRLVAFYWRAGEKSKWQE